LYDLSQRGAHEEHILHKIPMSATRDDKVKRSLPGIRQGVGLGAVLKEELCYTVMTVVRSPVLYESAMAHTKKRAFNLQSASKNMPFQ
jgi:hypothetical protein